MLHPCCSGGLNAGKAQGKADAIRGVENNSCTSYQKAKIYVSCGRAEFGIAAAMVISSLVGCFLRYYRTIPKEAANIILSTPLQ
jgi:hypothetical protein